MKFYCSKFRKHNMCICERGTMWKWKTRKLLAPMCFNFSLVMCIKHGKTTIRPMNVCRLFKVCAHFWKIYSSIHMYLTFEIRFVFNCSSYFSFFWTESCIMGHKGCPQRGRFNCKRCRIYLKTLRWCWVELGYYYNYWCNKHDMIWGNVDIFHSRIVKVSFTPQEIVLDA